jgi:hypothetical protein
MAEPDELHAKLERSFQAIKQIQDAFSKEDIPCVLIGGYAVRLWGGVRVTEDIDLAVYKGDSIEPLRILTRLFGKEQVRFSPSGDPSDPFLATMEVQPPDCFPIEVLNYNYRQDHGRAIGVALKDPVTKNIADVDVHVCSLESLIVLKLLASGTRDLEDVRTLVEEHEGDLNFERVREILSRVRRSELFERYFSVVEEEE